MSDPRRFRWARVSARVAAGTAVAVGFVLALGAVAAVPLPGYRAEPVAVEALPTPSDAIIACPGPLLASARTSEQAATLDVAASAGIVAATASGAAPTPMTLTGPAAEGPTAYVVPPEGRTAAVVAAASSASVDAADLRGFAASACRPAVFDSWIVAGSAATGAADLVVVANPGAVTATVTVTVYGTDGAVTSPGGTAVVVAPGAQLALPLAGLRLGETTPVVEVVATGAPVVAALQSSVTRTLVPGGVEQTAASVAPDARAVIPGVLVPDGVEPGAEPATVLRLLAPSSDGTATITLTRADGGAVPAVQPVPLVAGQPVEVDLGALAGGLYSVQVDADAAVIGAVKQATGFGDGADFAWYATAPALSASVLATVADGPSPVLALANPSAAPATVTVTVAGAPTEVVVPAAGSASLAVGGGSVVTVDAGAGPVFAAIAYSGGGALSGYALWPGDPAAAAITVHP